MKKSRLIILVILSIILLAYCAFLFVHILDLKNKPNYPYTLERQQMVVENSLTIDELDFPNDVNKSKLKFKNMQSSNFTYNSDFTEIYFINVGEYIIEIINDKNKLIAKFVVCIEPNIQSLEFNLTECNLFINKLPSSQEIILKDGENIIPFNYVNFTYDSHIINFSNGIITAQGLGTTNIVASYKTLTASLSVTINEWNYAQSINFIQDKILLKEGQSSFALETDVAYINESNYKDDIIYNIVSGSEFCSLEGNSIIPLSEGNVVVSASIPSSSTTNVTDTLSITIEPIRTLSISLLESNFDVPSIINSGKRADNTYVDYAVKINSNLNFTNNELNALTEFITENYSNVIGLSTNLNSYVLNNECVIYIHFLNSETINLEFNIPDTAGNYTALTYSNILIIEPTAFATELLINPIPYLDNENNEYMPESRIENDITIYTIYNAQGDSNNLEHAIKDCKPYYINFDTNIPTYFDIIDENIILSQIDNQFTRISTGTQNINLKALDGSLLEKRISIEILDIELQSCYFDLQDEYNIYLDDITTIDCMPNYSPAYATHKPEIGITINDNNFDRPCAEIQENNFVALKKTTTPIYVTVVILNDVVTKTFVVNIYDTEQKYTLVNNQGINIDNIAQKVNDNALYYVLLDGATPSINNIQYLFLDSSSFWVSNINGLILGDYGGGSFILKATLELETKLKIIIDNSFELIIPILIVS